MNDIGTSAEGDGRRSEDLRRRRARLSREAMAGAALELLLERGLERVTVEAVAERAGVTRRTFSRHFSGRAEAALDPVRTDAHRVNDALRARPADEPPLTAYGNAVRDWYAAAYVHGTAGLSLPLRHRLFRHVDGEPALFAAYQRLRTEAEVESVRITAARMGVDPARDPRPTVTVGAGAGTLVAALRAWSRGTDPEALPRLLREHFAALAELSHAPRVGAGPRTAAGGGPPARPGGPTGGP